MFCTLHRYYIKLLEENIISFIYDCYQGCTNNGEVMPRQLSFVYLCLIFVGSQYSSCFLSPVILRWFLGFLKVCSP
jgi:hypothetical protein